MHIGDGKYGRCLKNEACIEEHILSWVAYHLLSLAFFLIVVDYIAALESD